MGRLVYRAARVAWLADARQIVIREFLEFIGFLLIVVVASIFVTVCMGFV